MVNTSNIQLKVDTDKYLAAFVPLLLLIIDMLAAQAMRE